MNVRAPRWTGLGWLLSLALAMVAGAAEEKPVAEAARHFHQRPLMGTLFTITAYGGTEEAAAKAVEEAFAVAEEINRVASDYMPDSELMRLTPGKAVEVSPLFAELLTPSFALAEATGGKFDPTLGPLTRLWRESRTTRKLPPPDRLAAAREATGWKNVTWDAAARRITLHKPGMQLDLGGIAKGFAADRMFDVMKARGFPSSCIAAGGDLRLGDPPPGRKAWRVGLQTFDEAEPEEVVELVNCAVSTSGDLHQHVEIDGKRYSHILDPATGLGLTVRLAVTAISPSGTLCDALDTAACVAGPEEAEALALRCGATRVIVRLP